MHLPLNIADVQYSINRSEDQTDKDSLAVNLEEYRYFDISDLPIHQKHHNLIQSISAKESISLIDYIVVTEVDDINKRPTYKEMDMSKNNNHSIAFNINKNKQYEMILIDIFGVKTKKIIKKG